MATILVVDDNVMVGRMLARFLQGNGHKVIVASSGAEALAAAAALPSPDLILLDLCMPEMDGIEVLRRLKQIGAGQPAQIDGPAPKNQSKATHVNGNPLVTGELADSPRSGAPRSAAMPGPPVILFSAVDDPAVMATAFLNGACDYWVKASFKFGDLPKAIEQHLARAHGVHG